MVTRQHIDSFRAYGGGLILALGCFGLLIFALSLPVVAFSVHFWTSFSLDGQGMSAAQRDVAISHALWGVTRDRLIPFFLGSLALIGYGFYEAMREKRFG